MWYRPKDLSLLGVTFQGDSNDSKRHVTPISVDHFSISFETVPNAPILIGTTLLLCAISRSVSTPASGLGSSQFSLSLCLSLECQNGQATSIIRHLRFIVIIIIIIIMIGFSH